MDFKKGLGCTIMAIPALVFVVMMFSGLDIGPVEGTTMWVFIFLGFFILKQHEKQKEKDFKRHIESMKDIRNDDNFNVVVNPAMQFKNNIQKQLIDKKNGSTVISWVEDEHRRHPWSIMPGGCTVVVIFSDKKCFGYDKVKRPHKYLQKITNDYICNLNCSQKVNNLESYIDSIYAVKEGETSLNSVWTRSDEVSPWDLLQKYATN